MFEHVHLCPVCGYSGLTEPPYSDDGGGSYEYCPSCGFHFGRTDDDLGFSHESWRAAWIEEGMPWRGAENGPYPRERPWNPKLQLARVFRAN